MDTLVPEKPCNGAPISIQLTAALSFGVKTGAIRWAN